MARSKVWSSWKSRVNLFAALRQAFWSTTTLCASVRQRIIDICCLIQWDIEFPLFYSPFLRQNVRQKPYQFFLCSEDLLELGTQIHPGWKLRTCPPQIMSKFSRLLTMLAMLCAQKIFCPQFQEEQYFIV